mmetsp:Transcript_4550/g.8076  ORF Transcript_4550/g.8076 Transcript_4550/m.8076 type:complete len:93 (+) Transcript_4550:173-451(+)
MNIITPVKKNISSHSELQQQISGITNNQALLPVGTPKMTKGNGVVVRPCSAAAEKTVAAKKQEASPREETTGKLKSSCNQKVCGREEQCNIC